MQITYPNYDKLAPDQEIDADVLKGLFQTLADHVIVPEDISPVGGFPGSMIQTNSMNADRLISGSITPAQMGVDSVATAAIQDLAVTRPNLSTTVGLRAALAQLEVTVHEVTFNDPITVAGTAWASEVAHNPSSNFPVATYQLLAIFARELGVSGAANALKTVTPKVSAAGANWACTLRADGGGTGNAGNVSGTLVYVFIAKT